MTELEVMKFWEDNNIFKKSIENRQGNKEFVLYEGPPTANGMPGIHHVLTRTYKDIIARYQTMQGKYVERKAGWDEHGLPVEIEVQKQNKLNTKSDIEAFGIGSFNKLCSESTQKYIKHWEHLTQRMGYWLDFANAYRTSSPEYIERVWEILHKMLDEGLIYKSFKVVPWAWDSETVLSNAEVALGYKEVKHLSAYILFKLVSGQYLLAWTTTPWTLPANMALAVNPDLKYNVYLHGDKQIIALNCDDLPIIGTVDGKELIGKEYVFYGRTCKVFSGDFVKNEKTGVVHIAPAFGQDDYNLYKDIDDKIICHLKPNGVFDYPDYLSGLSIREYVKVNKILLKNLGEAVFKTESYTHQYPHNWRTGEPLVYYLRPSYYVNVNKIRDKLLAVSEEVNWFPEHIKKGRFGEWLKGGVDWAISRERYWGTPLPFNDLEFNKPRGHHKPESESKEVLDCWFDSGSMPFAAFDEYKQADIICEAVDQTRGWFYSLAVIGTILKGEFPYKNVICVGHVLDKEGKKMSKSNGNSVDPLSLFDKYGADAVRLYMVRVDAGTPILFDEKELRSQLIAKVNNCLNYLKTYDKGSNTIECITDSWILAKLSKLTNLCIDNYNNYNIHLVVSHISAFVEELSNIWIRTNRYRFSDEQDGKAYEVLSYCLEKLSLLMAPITPFLSESIWQELKKSSSVHLQDFPKYETISLALLEEMDYVLGLVNQGRNIRNDCKIKIQQPLSMFVLPENRKVTQFENFIKNEVNVKDISYGENLSLETELTEELILEGQLRAFVRSVQAMRKGLNLSYKDRINLYLKTDNLQFKSVVSSKMEKLGVSNFYELEEDGEVVKIDNFVVHVKIENVH